MLEEIVSGRDLSPGTGWFALSKLETRFGWDVVRDEYDADGDDQVTPAEFPGSEADFARLDRDGDKVVTAADLDWSAPFLPRLPGSVVFGQSDVDSNGKVTPEEFAALFAKLDSDSRGYLSLEDLREKFQVSTTPPDTPQPDEPSMSTLVLALADQEVGSLRPGPALNETAPDFMLRSLDGTEVTLSEEIGEQPIVLIFGNFTCGPFRSQAGNIEKLYERYQGRAKFFLIYVREAHPKESWWMQSNQRVGIEINQPLTDADRIRVAGVCRDHLHLPLPFLVDTIDDTVGGEYSGMPNRLYLIDQDGKVAFKTARGPFGFHTRALEQALVMLLADGQEPIADGQSPCNPAP
jgi:hypothetical protein